MRRRGFIGFTLAALVVLSAGVVSAQGGGGGGRRGGGMMGRGGGLQMLRIPEVQQELKMTPDQIAKIDAKQDEMREAMQGMFQNGGGGGELSPEDRQKRMTQMQQIQSKAVAGILDATQQKRFRQLELQQQGPAALARPDVAAELKLTADQQKQIATIQRESLEGLRSGTPGGNGQDMSALRDKMEQARKAAGDKVAALLTDAQKAQWKAMQGAPFTFPARGPGRPGAGGGRGGAGGAGGAGRTGV